MAIRASTAREVERLTGDLCNGSAVAQDAAVARLRIIGVRAIGRLLQVLASDASPDARRAALKALDGIDDRRVLDAAVRAADDPSHLVASAAVDILRHWVLRERGTRVVETLSRLALDSLRDPALRLAALDGLSELPARVVRPILEAVTPALEPQAEQTPDLADRDPLSAREWVGAHPDAPLSALYALVRQARHQEQEATSQRVRQEWRVTRGAAHAALASRGSRVAVFDLREAFDAGDGPLPLDFLTAITRLGDGSCLEPLARSWTAARDDRWWRERVRAAAAEILDRHRLDGRHTVVRRVRKRWPGFL